MLLGEHFKEASQHLPAYLNLSSERFSFSDFLPAGEDSLMPTSHDAYKMTLWVKAIGKERTVP
ncbi:hypothetical protein NC992_17260 [Leptolyngbya subtilissima DQ-A4]|uniref:Uncharacterized protein n=1 Tax=Leptolyngbya subtilissima DQ-A4 TaxID=2933933 RepID=A0ABV0K770_9CYAN